MTGGCDLDWWMRCCNVACMVKFGRKNGVKQQTRSCHVSHLPHRPVTPASCARCRHSGKFGCAAPWHVWVFDPTGLACFTQEIVSSTLSQGSTYFATFGRRCTSASCQVIFYLALQRMQDTAGHATDTCLSKAWLQVFVYLMQGLWYQKSMLLESPPPALNR